MEWFIALYLAAGLSHFIWDKDNVRCIRKARDKLVVFLICLLFWPVVTVFKAAQ